LEQCEEKNVLNLIDLKCFYDGAIMYMNAFVYGWGEWNMIHLKLMRVREWNNCSHA